MPIFLDIIQQNLLKINRRVAKYNVGRYVFKGINWERTGFAGRNKMNTLTEKQLLISWKSPISFFFFLKSSSPLKYFLQENMLLEMIHCILFFIAL
jgi:hypothetical protein